MHIITTNKPAKFLLGKNLPNDWIVVKKISPDFEIGGSFSVNYLVQKNGVSGFLKALDFSIALESDDPTNEIIALSKDYEFEKQLWELCNDKNLSKIVKILDKGVLKPDEGGLIPVPYFILEYSVSDLKSQIVIDSYLNSAWLFKILHSVTVALYQLHKVGIAVKELKVESVRSFGGDLFKLSELGTARLKGAEGLKSERPLKVDPNATTIESLYGFQAPDWIYNSQAADAYNLGSLTLFLFTQFNMTACIYMFLDEQYHWKNWNKPYKDVLPYLYEAFEEAVYFIKPYIENVAVGDELMKMLKELCDPDPFKRGHPKDIASVGSSLSLYRYITRFDRWSKLSIQKMTQ